MPNELLLGALAGAVTYFLLQRQSVQKASSSWGWGLFCSPLPNHFTRAVPSILFMHSGKLPVASKGPIAWIDGSDVKDGIDVGNRNTTIVPVGSVDSNANAVLLQGEISQVETLLSKQYPLGYKWVSPRDMLMLGADRASQVEVEAVVRAASLLAWHGSHGFNSADGTPTTFAPGTSGRRRKLTSGRSLYPRVDPVAIVLVTSADGERCLLGRQKSYPPGMWTCVSGFVEHGESAERAAAREVLEETSVVVAATELVASQPWPCGRGASCELMLAVAARAAAGAAAEHIDVVGDGSGGGGELEAAQWFDRPTVARMLEGHKPAGVAPGADAALYVPPAFAIAHHMIRQWEQRTLKVP